MLELVVVFSYVAWFAISGLDFSVYIDNEPGVARCNLFFCYIAYRIRHTDPQKVHNHWIQQKK